MGLLGESSMITAIGFIVSIVAFVIQLIGFSTPYWYKDKLTTAAGNVDINYGLWQYCIGGTCTSWSSDNTDSPLKAILSLSLKNSVLIDQFDATRAMECLGFIALLAAVAFVILKLFVLKEIDKLYMYLVIAGCNVFAGLTAGIGIITYSTIKGGDSATLHFSYAFCIIAAVGAFAAGVLIVVGKFNK